MTTTTAPLVAAPSRLRARALVVVAAVVAPALVWLAAVPLLGVDLAAAAGSAPSTPVGLPALLASFTPLLLPGDTAPLSRVVLGPLHLTVAGVAVPGLRATSPQRAS